MCSSSSSCSLTSPTTRTIPPRFSLLPTTRTDPILHSSFNTQFPKPRISLQSRVGSSKTRATINDGSVIAPLLSFMEAMSFYELLGIPETGTLGEIKQAYKKWMGFIYCLCYICLVEYEEGDSVRILPCHHEFHKPCIDKWLKEIHRICPLCRGDICRSDSLPIEN